MGSIGLLPASKTSMNRKNSPSQVERAGPTDSFPTNLLGFLRTLASDTISQDAVESGPRKKRARIDHVESIPIAREFLAIKRPAHSDEPDAEPISYANVQSHMRIQYDDSEHILNFSSIPQSPYGTFKSEVNLGHPQFTKRMLVILEVLSRSRDTSNEGALWVSVGVELDRKSDKDLLQLSLELNWNSTTYFFRNTYHRALSRRVLDTFFSGHCQGRTDAAEEKMSPQAFYNAAFVPKNDHTNYLSLTAPRLTSRLFPFQRRALQWLLNREGVKWSDRCSSNGKPGLELLHPTPTGLPLSFSVAKDADGRSVFVSDLYHVVTRDIAPFRQNESDVKGGILAEEMGLGKTVETISLICMHTREGSATIHTYFAADNVRLTGATLIITPLTLQKQWIAEFKKHAPHLRVTVYHGMKGFEGDEDELVSSLVEQNVVITTYNVLQAEIHHTEKPPDRFMRHERKYDRLTTPLTKISWWRVCLDEAQQIESGVSNSAKVARLIPRVNSWGITGTPVKENIKDLWGLLVFLRYEPFASSTAIWEGLITTHKEFFKPLFNRIALRHTKRAVRSELTLPPQKRFVITMPFTAIEEQHYREHFKQLVTNLGLDTNGAPLEDSWDPDDPSTIDMMKRALDQLRQSILHPSLGSTHSLRAQIQKNKPLRTVAEVLDAMIDASESSIRADQRSYLLGQLERGQILENRSKFREAIGVWEKVVEEVKFLEDECRQQLEIELKKLKRTSQDEDIDDTKSTSSQNDEGPDEATAGRISECRRKLRSMLDIHHRAVFFIASGYYQMKDNLEQTQSDSEQYKLLDEKETSGYETAKNIRKEILHEARSKAFIYIEGLGRKARSQAFVDVPEITVPSLHGLESRRVLDNFQILGFALNAQADLMDQWRECAVQMLIRPLVDEEDEPVTGNEYEDSTKIQDELMVYTLALRALIADRQDATSGLENERIKYDTKFAEDQAKEGKGHAPKLVLKLLEERKKVKSLSQGISFRGIVTDLRELATKVRHDISNGSHRAKVELDIVEKQLRAAQEQIAAQNKATTVLERELDVFTTAMNCRVDYYRQLQGVSDTVVPLDMVKIGDWIRALDRIQENDDFLRKKVALAVSKHRYLLHLKDGGGQKAEEICVICRSPFALGVLTVCGHMFCKECLMFWFKTSRSCPVCKKHLTTAMLHDITLKKQELRVHQEHTQGQSQVANEDDSVTKSKSQGIYSEFGKGKLEAIKSIDLNGPSYATKVETLTKHLKWLRVEDPGAKSVIFSQFAGFLDILRSAFDHYNIGYTSFKMKDGIQKFKEDPAIECFLMDARSHASGLNLVNASHVFLCEPVLNTALELQAIARVDRIGQEHETTVWLYLIDGTVEESIYNLSVKRRLEHLGKNASNNTKTKNGKGKGKQREGERDDEQMPELSDLSLEAANSMELEQAELSKLMSKDRSLGENIDKNDLWQCLFGHVAKQQAATDERMNDPAVIGFLAGEAAEARRLDEDQGSE
ncbi:SNF2 family N-terminal domain-containing protein [Hypoxylon trugodes]|uniref:SNF2 family N-terminal domain-containing protein n=1 Tax=Hypoxylon trugodes TaxID=326681 RepID=UPI00218ED154|nr:SNF2 family N-terminal domain-containing protein [Hypoxylon trugodes]KAI1391186.1 SNF2 family N-terminal domain-containing protein [Hypoxylon trugodes]